MKIAGGVSIPVRLKEEDEFRMTWRRLHPIFNPTGSVIADDLMKFIHYSPARYSENGF